MSTNKGDVSRAPNGIATNDISQNLGFYGLPDPTKYHTFFDDFDSFISSDYTISLFGVSSGVLLVDEDGGVLSLFGDITPGDAIQIQRVNSTFLFLTGKPIFFKSRIKLSEDTLSIFNIGLYLTAGDPNNVQNGVYFRKESGVNTAKLIVVNSGISTRSDDITIPLNEYTTLGFYYNGDNIKIFQDNLQIGGVSSDNFPASGLSTVSMYFENQEIGVQNDMKVDYFFSSKVN